MVRDSRFAWLFGVSMIWGWASQVRVARISGFWESASFRIGMVCGLGLGFASLGRACFEVQVRQILGFTGQ